MTLALAFSIVQQYAEAKQANQNGAHGSKSLDARAIGLAYGAAFNPDRGYGGNAEEVSS